MYILKTYRWFWLILFVWIIAIALVFHQKGSVESNEIVLAAPRDIAPGPKDSYFVSSIAMVWEPLIGVDAQGSMVGVLATHWESNEDNTEWTFYLKDNVTFHDGTIFNSDAVIRNVQRWQAMRTKPSPFYSFNIKAMYPGLINATAGGDNVVIFHLKSPDPVFPERLINFSSAMFSPNSFDLKTGDFINADIGTGPFKLKEYKKNQYVLLSRNEMYHGNLAQADTIRIRAIPNADTRYAALKAEEIVGVVDIGAIPPALTRDLLKDERFALSTNNNTLNQVLTVNQSKWPFSDPRMIRAISLIIHRDDVINTYFSGQAVPYGSILNSLNPYAIPMATIYDETQAKSLAHEVMGNQRVKASLLIPQYGINRYSYKEVGQYYQAIFKELGIDVSITILEGAAHKKLVSLGQYDFSLGTMGMSSYAPEGIFRTYLAENGSMNRLYHVGYYDERAELLLNNLKTDITKEAHIIKYNELQKISSEHMPAVVFGSDRTTLVYNQQKIDGFQALTYGVSLDTIHWR